MALDVATRLQTSHASKFGSSCKKLPPCSIRLSVRTLPFHGRKEGFDSPIEYQI
jgi:hypothetical protein